MFLSQAGTIQDDGNNKMRIFQEEIFGPVVSVTTFKNEAEALEIANDTLYGLGALEANVCFRMGRGIQWPLIIDAIDTRSGIGRETHKMMLHYRQTQKYARFLWAFSNQ